jgi:anti-sigma B factor antagonist
MEPDGIQHEVGPVVLCPSGELDHYSVWPLRDGIREALGDDSRGLIVSLEDVSFLDSTGLGLLVGAYKRAARVKAPFHIVCSHERVWKGFRITGLDKVMNVHASMLDALAAVAVERGWVVGGDSVSGR